MPLKIPHMFDVNVVLGVCKGPKGTKIGFEAKLIPHEFGATRCIDMRFTILTEVMASGGKSKSESRHE